MVGRIPLLLLVAAMSLASCGGDDADVFDGTCHGDGPNGLMGCVESSAYVDDLGFVAAERVGGSEHWQATQDLCATRLESLGFDVTLDAYGTGVNVIGKKQGTLAPDEQVLIGAHYDHIEGCSGADDNATGVAGVLEVARVLAQVETERTLVVACWDEEERGLIGSRNYAKRAADRGDQIVVAFNFDMIGYKSDEPKSQGLPEGFELFLLLYRKESEKFEANERRADFIFWIADERAPEEASLLSSYGDDIGLPTLGGVLPDGLADSDALADLRRSDHAAFWEFGFPSVFLTDTANLRYGGYHCEDGDDTIDRLDHEFSAQVVRATVGAITEILVVY